MNHVWHLFRKDLRQHRVLMASFWVLVLVQTLLYVQSLQLTLHPIADKGDQLNSWVGMLAAFKFVLLFLYVPAVIQSESLVGTTQFWLTRPLARLEVLGEKALYIGIVIWLPLLLPELAAFLAFGATPTEIALMIPQVLILWAVYLMALTLFAHVTPSLAKYALWIIGLFVGLQVATMLWEIIASHWAIFEFVESESSSGGGSTCALISMALLLFGGAGLLYYHYAKRRTGWVVAATVLLGVFMATTSLWWRWDFWGDWTRAIAARSVTDAERQLVNAADVQISASGEHMSLGDSRRWIRGRMLNTKLVTVMTTMSSTQQSIFYLPFEISTDFIDDGRVLKSDRQRKCNGQRFYESNLSQQALISLFPGVNVLNVPEKSNLMTGLNYGSVPDESAQEWQGKTISARAEMKLAAFRYVVLWTMPLEKKAHWRDGLRQMEIDHIYFNKDGCEVLLSKIKTSLALNPPPYANASFGYDRYFCLLVNAKRGEAIVQDGEDGSSVEWNNALGGDPLNVQHASASFTGKLRGDHVSDGDAKRRLSDVHLPRDWFRDAQLVCVELKEIGTVTKTVEISGLKFNVEK